MRFELPLIIAFIAHVAQANPTLLNNLKARQLEHGRKFPSQFY
ncbi:uncharacterized protein PgNI_07982 [Pyricularia grisea]|uniref:Uncharacterized protein n=1 Tax=Pyricularia grisea TaxID=148305 RepID=A0A6P8B203_PYRGI|nr:uncharacterized protein PgNI_07982 [Pyricularia grisea]TLD08748.1 hypothetical protein PgNI_07982 [Pyricularia grisea]